MSNPPRDPIQPHRTRPASEVARATGALADARLARPRRSRQPPSPSWFESFVVGCDPIACALFGVLPAGVPPSPRRARPDRSPRGAEPFPERYYVGRRPASSTPQVFLVGEGVEPLRHPGFRTTAGFDWGRDTAGALELAYAMLSHALAASAAKATCRQFAREILAALDPDGFVLSCEEVVRWVIATLPQAEIPRDAHPGPIARAAARIRRWHRRRQIAPASGSTSQ